MKTITILLTMLMVAVAYVTPAAAASGYEVCVRVPDQSNARTDYDLHITLRGANGTTARLELDNPGADDYNRNTLSCFKFPFSKARDVGQISAVWLLLRGSDDVCLNNVSVEYSRGGTFNASHQFCLGDDAQSPAPVLTPKANKVTKADGRPLSGGGLLDGSGGNLSGCGKVRAFNVCG